MTRRIDLERPTIFAAATKISKLKQQVDACAARATSAFDELDTQHASDIRLTKQIYLDLDQAELNKLSQRMENLSNSLHRLNINYANAQKVAFIHALTLRGK